MGGRTRSAMVALAAALLSFAALPALADSDSIRFFNVESRAQTVGREPVDRLRFVMTTDLPPFGFRDGAGRLSGFHLDLARLICRQLELEERCSIQSADFNEIEGLLQLGTADAALAGHAVTADRQRRFAFSQPYFRWPHRFLARRDSGFQEPLADALLDKRVGVMRGTVHEAALRSFFPGSRAVVFDSERLLRAAVKTGRIDAAYGDGIRLGFSALADDAEGCCALVGGPYFARALADDRMAVMVRADDPAFVETVDAALRELQREGALDDLLLRWFPFDLFGRSGTPANAN